MTDDLRALFDRALFQAFPSRMTHVRDTENADLLWDKIQPLIRQAQAEARASERYALLAARGESA